MPVFICKQPNGLYCRFSTIVDTFTHVNMTEQEYIDYCVEEAKKYARYILNSHTNPLSVAKEHFVPINNTIEEFDEMLHEMGDEKGLGEERIRELKEKFEK